MQIGDKTTVAKSARIDFDFDGLIKKVVGKKLLKCRNGAKLFSQGENGDAIYFVQKGRVQLTVVSAQGKEARLAELGPSDFFGEECLIGSSRRTSSATTLKPSAVFRIEKHAMLKALHLDPRFSEVFMNSLLARSINLENDLSDQLFDHSEKRLACALLKLIRHGRHEKLPSAKLPKITQKMLAEMIGTTRSRVGVFMNKFRKLGLIDYRGTGDITVIAERMTEAVLHD
jgi:CRP/FNR family transcriptional regulator, cyclic AMP receptor protein